MVHPVSSLEGVCTQGAPGVVSLYIELCSDAKHNGSSVNERHCGAETFSGTQHVDAALKTDETPENGSGGSNQAEPEFQGPPNSAERIDFTWTSPCVNGPAALAGCPSEASCARRQDWRHLTNTFGHRNGKSYLKAEK